MLFDPNRTEPNRISTPPQVLVAATSLLFDGQTHHMVFRGEPRRLQQQLARETKLLDELWGVLQTVLKCHDRVQSILPDAAGGGGGQTLSLSPKEQNDVEYVCTVLQHLKKSLYRALICCFIGNQLQATHLKLLCTAAQQLMSTRIQ
jgi:hypothetical protein